MITHNSVRLWSKRFPLLKEFARSCWHFNPEAPTTSLSSLDSCIEGNPYLPEGTLWPTSPEGNKLRLLAQVNFAQITDRDPDMPTQGILQVFYDFERMPFGTDEGDENYYCVRFFPEVPPSIDDAALLISSKTLPMYDLLPAAVRDRIDDIEIDEDWDTYDMMLFEDKPKVPQILGFGVSPQSAPELAEHGLSGPARLLMSFDSDEDRDWFFGDGGTLSVLITHEDFLARNLDRARIVLQCF